MPFVVLRRGDQIAALELGTAEQDDRTSACAAQACSPDEQPNIEVLAQSPLHLRVTHHVREDRSKEKS